MGIVYVVRQLYGVMKWGGRRESGGRDTLPWSMVLSMPLDWPPCSLAPPPPPETSLRASCSMLSIVLFVWKSGGWVVVKGG